MVGNSEHYYFGCGALISTLVPLYATCSLFDRNFQASLSVKHFTPSVSPGNKSPEVQLRVLKCIFRSAHPEPTHASTSNYSCLFKSLKRTPLNDRNQIPALEPRRQAVKNPAATGPRAATSTGDTTHAARPCWLIPFPAAPPPAFARGRCRSSLRLRRGRTAFPRSPLSPAPLVRGGRAGGHCGAPWRLAAGPASGGQRGLFSHLQEIWGESAKRCRTPGKGWRLGGGVWGGWASFRRDPTACGSLVPTASVFFFCCFVSHTCAVCFSFLKYKINFLMQRWLLVVEHHIQEWTLRVEHST